MDFQLGSAEPVGGGLEFDGSGGLFIHEALEGVVIFLFDLEFQLGGRDAVFDIGALGGFAGFEGLHVGAGFGDPRLRGFDGGIGFGIGECRRGRA